MREALKTFLTQQIVSAERDFRRLDLSVMPWNEAQISGLDALRGSIQRLKQTINRAPITNAPVTVALRQDINAQLAVLSGFAQVLLKKQAGDVGVMASKLLENIVNASYGMQDMMEADKDVMQAGA